MSKPVLLCMGSAFSLPQVSIIGPERERQVPFEQRPGPGAGGSGDARYTADSMDSRTAASPLHSPMLTFVTSPPVVCVTRITHEMPRPRSGGRIHARCTLATICPSHVCRRTARTSGVRALFRFQALAQLRIAFRLHAQGLGLRAFFRAFFCASAFAFLFGLALRIGDALFARLPACACARPLPRAVSARRRPSAPPACVRARRVPRPRAAAVPAFSCSCCCACFALAGSPPASARADPPPRGGVSGAGVRLGRRWRRIRRCRGRAALFSARPRRASTASVA